MTKFLTGLEGEQPFSGVAAVRQNGKEIFTLVKGVADAGRDVKVSRATRFGMASGSKMFTATGILQLAQAGKLSLNDPPRDGRGPRETRRVRTREAWRSRDLRGRRFDHARRPAPLRGCPSGVLLDRPISL
jgi:hypothetical protein